MGYSFFDTSLLCLGVAFATVIGVTLIMSLVRDVVWYHKYLLARLVDPALPPRHVKPFPSDVLSITFAGNGADARQSMRAYGTYPNSATTLHNPVLPMRLHEPFDVAPGPIRVYKWWDVNIGQEGDVRHALASVRTALVNNPGKRLVLRGTSRGAAVALQVAALLTSDEIAHVPLLICEAPFTTVADVIDARFAWKWERLLVRVGLRVFTSYRAKQSKQWSPMAVAWNFSHPTLPIVIVASKVDTVVPPQVTERLVDVLKRGGVQHVHTILLQASDHSSFSSDNDADRRTYVTELDALYNQYLH